MSYLTKLQSGLRSRTAGFSLLEVMVGVVVLSSGLLGLAGLQGALARNAADAKERSVIASAMDSHMSELRNAPPPAAVTTLTMANTSWVNVAAGSAKVPDLQVREDIKVYYWAGTEFKEMTAAITPAPAVTFFRAKLTASWTGVNSKSSSDKKSLVISSDISNRIYGSGDGYPDYNPNGSASRKPIVRQNDPGLTPGVIPIAAGGQSSAASNPSPEIVSSGNTDQRVATSFDTYNYRAGDDNVAQILKRFQTQVVKCSCAYTTQAGADYSVAGEPQWPAVWDGDTYSLYQGGDTPGGKVTWAKEDPDFAGKSNGKGRSQSPLCTECCRDHHDKGGSDAESRFDPERTTGGVSKYVGNQGSFTDVAFSNGNKYFASCRLIKVGGLWRTTVDMYLRQYGLLETESKTEGGVVKLAATAVPTKSASDRYENFVRDYLKQYTSSSTTAPAGALDMFNESSRLLNEPPRVSIPTANSNDRRYLHGRGLYVDYLGKKAREKLDECKGMTGEALVGCILSRLPFTTINLTNISDWAAESASGDTVKHIYVNTRKALPTASDMFGGETYGVSAGKSLAASKMRLSNSGVAVVSASGLDPRYGIDPADDTSKLSDSQEFLVAGGSLNGFIFNIVGGGDNPYLSYSVGGDLGSCSFDGELDKFACATNTALPSAGQLMLSLYARNIFVATDLDLAQCVSTTAETVAGQVVVDWPKFVDYTIPAANVSGGVLAATDPITTTDPGKIFEVTTIKFASIPKEPEVITVTLNEGATQSATVASCSYTPVDGVATNINVVWTKPWMQP